jgi:two-component system, cell cycle sensor histidine kinase and response regulator CckA
VDNADHAVRVLGAAVSVDRRKSAKLVRQRAEPFRNILDSMLEGCQLIGFDWTILYMNKAAQHGLEQGKHPVGRSLLDVYPRIEKSAAFVHYRRCMKERTPQHFEDAVTLPDGTNTSREVSVVPVPDGIFVLSRDVTERIQAEKDLRRNEERLRQAVRVSGTGIFDHDHSSELVYWSPEQYTIYGWTPETPVTVPKYLAAVHPEDRERIAAAVRRAHDPAGDGFFDVEHRLVRPDGSVRWTNIRSQTFFEGTGENRHPVRTVGAATDITDRKQAEAEKARLEERLFQAQKMESIGRLAGGVAHDFNNLLTVINGYSDLLLKRRGAGDPAQAPLQEIKKAGLRAAELTQQLLAFSREQIAVPKVLNLNTVIRDLEDLLRRLIGEDITLVTVLSPELGRVSADPGQIFQVLINLAANSRDAMPHGGQLRIETANVDLKDRYVKEHPEAIPGPYVQLTVSDSGTGMDAETCTHIFEPFFTTKRVGEGTGLGLATVYGVVKQAGGLIRVRSEPGQGATFTIYLHRVEDTVEVEEGEGRPTGTRQGTETILLVEDQIELRKLFRTVLESYGYRVLEAANAEEALQRSERWTERIHLMLTDVVMPGMSGLDLATRLIPLRPQMKVIYMSGYSPTATLSEIQNAGIDYLQKPLSPADLVAKVREVLERG